jgi:hypothetical protein
VGSALDASMIIPDAVKDTLALVTAVVNSHVASAVDSAWSGVRLPVPDSESAASGVGEWVRGVLRREWRINCLDLVLRL